jgi:hypothetical protein
MSTSTANAFPLVRVNEGAIERAGTCLDGDNCPRYHCRACGQYWLGNARHTCGLDTTGIGAASHLAQLEERICGWMAEALDQEADLSRCTRKVLDQVKAAGLGEALLDAYGDRLIRELWADRDHDGDEPVRVNGVTTVIPRARQPALQVHRVVGVAWESTAAVGDEDRATAPGTRLVDLEQLTTSAALLESLFHVDGNWIRLGDLDRRRCRVLQLEYEAMANAARTRALAFGLLVAGLDEGQTVRSRWTVEQLEDLVGDTLGRAAPARPNG